MKTIITVAEMVKEIGLPPKEIAEQAGVSHQVLRNQLHHGVKVARLADGTFIPVKRNSKVYGKPTEDAAY